MISYNRIIQWVSGPFSVLIGGIAVKMVNNWNFLGSIGLGKATTAHAIADGTVFAVSSGVTYLAHHKWLDNAARWWETQVGTPLPLTGPDATAAWPTLVSPVSPDNPDPTEVVQTRQTIAADFPTKDPLE